jgi:N-acetylglucosaminyldiphosphoundecaprenol N-acetyl-beta-D-mannosaminyltransferase
MVERFKVGKVEISIINLEKTIQVLQKVIQNNQIGYICLNEARTAFLANYDSEYCSIQNNSLLTLPDGMSLVWIAHNKGFKKVGKVSGKDLMDKVFTISKRNGYSHYFFGSTPHTIDKLRSNLQIRFPELEIKRAVSPPFQPLEKFDIDDLAKKINEIQPTFFWCGLGAPKQEQLIALLQPKLTNTICIGVGLAFEYLAGTVKRAPLYMQKLGLEWLYRLVQQPMNIKRTILAHKWMYFQIIKSALSRIKYIGVFTKKL